MATTLSGSYTTTQKVNASDNPVYVTGTIVVPGTSSSLPNALQSSTTFAATVTNSGTIVGAGFGVSLGEGSVVLNQAGGTIVSSNTGNVVGLFVYGGSTVTNAGSIGGVDGGSHAANTVVNQSVIASTGSFTTGVQLSGGGIVSNAANATISGQQVGVGLSGGTGTLTNYGTVMGGTSSTGLGVDLGGGGLISNYGTISGYSGVEFTGTLGGTVSNAKGALITSTNAPIGNPFGSIGRISVVNDGSILSNAPGGTDAISRANDVTNGSDGLIVGPNGIYILTGTAINYGTVIATGSYGSAIFLDFGGYARNAAGGTLSGAVLAKSIGTVVNQGLVQGYVALTSGGEVTNAAGAIINASTRGVDIAFGQGTLVNAGTIAVTSGDAVYFQSGYADKLVVEPGAVFDGTISGGNAIGSSIVSTLELGAGVGTLAGFGTSITNFGAIQFDPSANWTLTGVLAGFAGTITGFTLGDSINITDLVATSGTYAAGQLNLYDNGTAVGHIAITGSFASDVFPITPLPGGGSVITACFAAGTRIETTRGEVAVDRLRVGDEVLAHRGDGVLVPRPVIWVGYRAIDCRRHPMPHRVLPVRIRAGAFGAGRPRRDLRLSPDHAVFVADDGARGVLIPIHCLINGRSIVREQVAAVSYFHVELSAHAVLLAEGLPTESYLDTGNRAAFANGGRLIALNPDFASRAWDVEACVPLVVAGSEVDAARAWLDAIAAGEPLKGFRRDHVHLARLRERSARSAG